MKFWLIIDFDVGNLNMTIIFVQIFYFWRKFEKKIFGNFQKNFPKIFFSHPAWFSFWFSIEWCWSNFSKIFGLGENEEKVKKRVIFSRFPKLWWEKSLWCGDLGSMCVGATYPLFLYSIWKWSRISNRWDNFVSGPPLKKYAFFGKNRWEKFLGKKFSY